MDLGFCHCAAYTRLAKEIDYSIQGAPPGEQAQFFFIRLVSLLRLTTSHPVLAGCFCFEKYQI